MRPVVLLFMAVLLVDFSVETSAGTRTRRPKASPRPTAAVDRNDRITVLHLTSVTVMLGATQESKEYQITPATKITVDGKPSDRNGLAVGMDITVTTLPNEPTTAATIDAKTVKK